MKSVRGKVGRSLTKFNLSINKNILVKCIVTSAVKPSKFRINKGKAIIN